jgi:hypothetical protein
MRLSYSVMLVEERVRIQNWKLFLLNMCCFPTIMLGSVCSVSPLPSEWLVGLVKGTEENQSDV